MQSNMNVSRSPQRGFTLIELVVVIVIIGILAAFAIPRFSNIAKDARISSVNSLLGSIRSTSALVHGLALARGNVSPISLEGTNVDIVNGYPAATATGIKLALSSTEGYDDSYSGSTATFQVKGSPAATGCSVSYTAAPSGGVPTITPNTNNC